MVLKSYEKLENNRCKFVVEVDGEMFNKAVNAVYKREVGKISVQGFRKGKAPRKIIEKMYGEGVFFEDAVNDILPLGLQFAEKETGVKIVNDKMDLDVKDVSVENGFTFEVELTIEPEVEIADYKGIEIEKLSTEVTEELLQAEIDKVLEQGSRLVAVEGRPAQNGDSVVIAFEGFLDGTPFEGGKADSHTLELGSGSFIPGFEEQIVGHNVDDEFTIDVTFPEDYQAEELKGKATQFAIKIHEIKEKEVPVLDDEFVKDVSEKDTVDEYKELLKEEIAQRLEDSAKRDIDDKVAEKLQELLQADIPEVMFENEAKEMTREMEARLQSQGIDMNMYMQYTGMTIEKMIEMNIEQATQRVKLRFALEKIAQIEDIQVTEEDIENEFAKIADTYKRTVEEVKNVIAVEDLTKDIQKERALEVVKNSIVLK